MEAYLATDDCWHIDLSDDFQSQLQEYSTKLAQLDRVQYSGIWLKKRETKTLKEHLKQVYEHIILKKKSIGLRFYNFENTPFDMDWIADFTEIEDLEIESWGEILNIEKLANFKNLKKLHLDFGLKMKGDLSFLSVINPDLQVLYIRAADKNPKVDLMPITHFKKLKALWVMYFEKNLDQAILQLPDLEYLRLRSISKYKDLDFIKHLTKLNSLSLEFCGLTDISAIAHLKNLTHLNLFRLLKIEQLDFLSELNHIEYIELDVVSSVSQFPILASLKKPCSVQIISCKNLIDYTNFAKTKSVMALRIENAPNANVDEFLPILQNEHIKYLSIYCKNNSINEQVKVLIQEFGKQRFRDKP